jgi:hypothetical protein
MDEHKAMNKLLDEGYKPLGIAILNGSASDLEAGLKEAFPLSEFCFRKYYSRKDRIRVYIKGA